MFRNYIDLDKEYYLQRKSIKQGYESITIKANELYKHINENSEVVLLNRVTPSDYYLYDTLNRYREKSLLDKPVNLIDEDGHINRSSTWLEVLSMIEYVSDVENPRNYTDELCEDLFKFFKEFLDTWDNVIIVRHHKYLEYEDMIKQAEEEYIKLKEDILDLRKHI